MARYLKVFFPENTPRMMIQEFFSEFDYEPVESTDGAWYSEIEDDSHLCYMMYYVGWNVAGIENHDREFDVDYEVVECEWEQIELTEWQKERCAEFERQHQAALAENPNYERDAIIDMESILTEINSWSPERRQQELQKVLLELADASGQKLQ